MSDFHRGVIDGIVITHHPKVSEDEATSEVPEMLLSRVSLYVRGLPAAHVDFFDDGFASLGSDVVLGRTVAMTGRLDRHHRLVTRARKAEVLALQPSPSNGCFLVPTVKTTTAGDASSTFDLISGQWTDSMAVAVERYVVCMLACCNVKGTSRSYCYWY